MGYNTARDMAEALPLEEALRYHLTVNHYPPVPTEMISVCVEAIEAMNDEDYNREIDLPAGTSHKGLTTAPACAIVEAHHLEAWLIDEEEY